MLLSNQVTVAFLIVIIYFCILITVDNAEQVLK